jgi:hypothetical protein
VDTGTDQITVDALAQNFPAGTIIGAYMHRYYVTGSIATNIVGMNNSGYISKLPYQSVADPAYCFHNQTGYIFGSIYADYAENALTTMYPDDDGYYAVQKPFIVEGSRDNDTSAFTYKIGINRAYGCVNSIYMAYTGTMVIDLDGITIGADNYLFFGQANIVFSAGSYLYACLLLDTEHAS